jgi:hypothetical protein
VITPFQHSHEHKIYARRGVRGKYDLPGIGNVHKLRNGLSCLEDYLCRLSRELVAGSSRVSSRLAETADHGPQHLGRFRERGSRIVYVNHFLNKPLSARCPCRNAS